MLVALPTLYIIYIIVISSWSYPSFKKLTDFVIVVIRTPDYYLYMMQHHHQNPLMNESWMHTNYSPGSYTIASDMVNEASQSEIRGKPGKTAYWLFVCRKVL